MDGASLLNLLGDDPEDEGHPGAHLLLQLLEVPLHRQPARDGVELEVGGVAAIPGVQDVADRSAQALVPVHCHDVADEVAHLAALRQPGHRGGGEEDGRTVGDVLHVDDELLHGHITGVRGPVHPGVLNTGISHQSVVRSPINQDLLLGTNSTGLNKGKISLLQSLNFSHYCY